GEYGGQHLRPRLSWCWSDHWSGTGIRLYRGQPYRGFPGSHPGFLRGSLSFCRQNMNPLCPRRVGQVAVGGQGNRLAYFHRIEAVTAQDLIGVVGIVEMDVHVAAYETSQYAPEHSDDRIVADVAEMRVG